LKPQFQFTKANIIYSSGEKSDKGYCFGLWQVWGVKHFANALFTFPLPEHQPYGGCMS
jgi:hypothetical protein